MRLVTTYGQFNYGFYRVMVVLFAGRLSLYYREVISLCTSDDNNKLVILQTWVKYLSIYIRGIFDPG